MYASKAPTETHRSSVGEARRGVILSDCARYRYALWRRWVQGPAVLFIGLNPSTADALQDDPTIRRCIRFAKAWGYRALYMANLFAFRATDPRDMKAVVDPVGPDNDGWLWQLAYDADLVVAAWGAHGEHRDRAAAVARRLAKRLHCLGRTTAGHPRHPLYVRRDARLEPWEGEPSEPSPITDSDVARLREVYFAPRDFSISDLGIRLPLENFSPTLVREFRRELARVDCGNGHRLQDALAARLAGRDANGGLVTQQGEAPTLSECRVPSPIRGDRWREPRHSELAGHIA